MRINRKASYDARRMAELEEVTKHDMLAFVETVGESLGEDAERVVAVRVTAQGHSGRSSSDGGRPPPP